MALNHPARWEIDRNTTATDDEDSSCVPRTSFDANCAIFNEPDLRKDKLWLSQFHWMRGFFVRPAGSNSGPQLQQLQAGEPVILEARVYNYSFAEMPHGTDVRVRFYGQRWNHNTNTPGGDSFLIDEKAYDRIPAFQSQDLLSFGNNPSNWMLARAEFDPTEYANQYLVFWVVVWMEDEDGNLVQEMADHGLESKPGELKTVAEVLIEGHSNNVGFYKHAFYVKPSVPQGGIPAPEDPADLIVEEMEATPEKVIVGEQVEIAAVVQNRGESVDGAYALFFEGDPGGGGELFDSELISHIPAGESYQLSIPFRPERCGLHRLFVVLQESDAISETLLDVPCFSEAAVVATNKVKIGRGAQVTAGNVVANLPDGTIAVGENAVTNAGSALIADHLRVKKGANVAGDVEFNTLENKGTITGNQKEQVGLPFFPGLPVFRSAPRGTEKIVARRNETKILEAGDYGKIVVKRGGRLVLTGGIFNVRSIRIASNAELRFTGRSEVRVGKNLKAGRQSFIGPDEGSGLTAEDIAFHVAGDKTKIGKGSVVHANFYVPEGKVQFKGSEARGSFLAEKVFLGKGSSLEVESFVNE